MDVARVAIDDMAPIVVGDVARAAVGDVARAVGDVARVGGGNVEGVGGDVDGAFEDGVIAPRKREPCVVARRSSRRAFRLSASGDGRPSAN